MSEFRLHNGDCIEVMSRMLENSVDAIVTDPPYGINFMGKAWDNAAILSKSVSGKDHTKTRERSASMHAGEYDLSLKGNKAFEQWTRAWAIEAFRILKPGGHLISFAGSRTYHRMASGIEDAGFEIRDQIMWIYGSGFPKSLDISKAIDKSDAAIARRERDLKFTAWMRSTGIKTRQIDEITQSNMGGHYLTDKEQPTVATAEMFDKLRPYLPEVPEWVEEMVRQRTIESENFKKREVIGTRNDGAGNGSVVGLGSPSVMSKIIDITASATAEAKQWQGWGTALKPAHEPMVLARKPVEGTVANNVLTYGVGGLNIDGTRVEGKVPSVPMAEWTRSGTTGATDKRNGELSQPHLNGRWPANVIHDGDQEVLDLFPNAKGMANQKSGKNIKIYGGNSLLESKTTFPETRQGYNDDGSAARFFYCAKASKRDRNEGLDGFEEKQITGGGGLTANFRKDGSLETASAGGKYGSIKAKKANHHPTVKPTDLMRYLCRLITPPNGIVLDPFMGSGSTGKAAMYENFNFIGIEQSAEYMEIAKARIEFALGDK